MRRALARRTLHRPAVAPRPAVARRAAPGDPCPEAACRGRLTVYHTHCEADVRIRYLECDRCGTKPAQNKQIVPLEFAPPRSRRGG